MPLAPDQTRPRFLPALDVDDPLHRELTAGLTLVWAPDPVAPGRILGCRIEEEGDLVPLCILIQPEADDAPEPQVPER